MNTNINVTIMTIGAFKDHLNCSKREAIANNIIKIAIAIHQTLIFAVIFIGSEFSDSVDISISGSIDSFRPVIEAGSELNTAPNITFNTKNNIIPTVILVRILNPNKNDIPNNIAAIANVMK